MTPKERLEKYCNVSLINDKIEAFQALAIFELADAIKADFITEPLVEAKENEILRRITNEWDK